MPTKESLLKKLLQKPVPAGFTSKELDSLILQFDLPHPRKELYRDQVRKVIAFLLEVGEIER